MNGIIDRIKWVLGVIGFAVVIWLFRGPMQSYTNANAAKSGAGDLWAFTFINQYIVWIVLLILFLIAIVTMIVVIYKSRGRG
jgi:hypothetical protein